MTKLKTILFAGLAASILASPAMAYDHRDHRDHWDHGYHRDHWRHERVVYAPPQPVYYVPAPVVYRPVYYAPAPVYPVYSPAPVTVGWFFGR